MGNSGPSPASKTARNIDVLVNAAGMIFIDGQPSDERAIYRDLAARAALDHTRRVTLTADARSHYGVTIRVLDAAKDAGLADVNFVTQ